MSHLVKDKKKILKTIRITFYFFIISILFIGTYLYEGNKIIFFIFGLSSNLIFLFIFSKKSYFFEIFFGGLLWLGFWYKSIVIINIDNFFSREGAGLYNNLNLANKIQIFDSSMIIVTYGFLGFLSACLIKNTFLFSYFDLKKIIKRDNNILNKKIVIFLSVIFFLFLILITFSNFYLGIYQRGIISTFKIHFTISAVYKWLLLFGFSSFIAFLFIFTFSNKSKIYALSSLSIVETFISNLSFLSRGMILNIFAIFIGLYKSNKIFNLKLSINFFLIYLISILCFFYVSVITVNYLRANIFFVKADKTDTSIDILKQDEDISIQKKKYNTPRKAFIEFLSLSKTRWVGMDAVLAVEVYDGKNFEFFKKSFYDKFNKEKYPYYERKVQKRIKSKKNTTLYGITTPGIFAYLYYTGSKNFVFTLILLISLIIFIFERFIFKIFNNPILCSLLSQVLAYRLVHFGYMPQNSYLLITSISITIIGLFIIKKIITSK